MVDQHIDIVYRPWEEKDENIRYKEEKKKAGKEEVSLFTDVEKAPTEEEKQEEKSE